LAAAPLLTTLEELSALQAPTGIWISGGIKNEGRKREGRGGVR